MCTLQTGTLCYNAININYVFVLICRIARELNLSSVMVLRKGICSLFIPLKLRSAVYVDTGLPGGGGGGAGGGVSYFPYILLNEIKTMLSQLAKRSARVLPADLCTDRVHYVKNYRSTVHSRPQWLRVWEFARNLSPLHAQKSSGSRLRFW